MSQIQIFPMQQEDVKVCREIILNCADEIMVKHYEPDQVEVVRKYGSEHMLEHLRTRDYPLNYAFVAKLDGVVRGVIMGRGSKMNMLFVDPKHHKQGVARQLCDHVIKFLKSKNVAWLWLHAAPNAVDFYLKTGFSDEGDDSVTFEKTITPTTFMQQFL